MLKKVVAALLAAAAFAPAAMAQEGGNDDASPRRMERQQMRENHDEGGRPQFTRDGGNQGQRPQFQRPQFQRPPEQQQQQQAPAVRPQPQPDRPRPSFGGRDDQRQPGWQREDGRSWRGDGIAGRQQREQFDAQARAQAQAQAQAQADARIRDRGFSDGDSRSDWRRRGDDRTPPVTVHRGDPNRGLDGRRFDGQRRFDGDPRFDGNRRYDAPNGNWGNRSDWSRRWRDDNRFDWGRYRNQNRNIFRLPRYYAPYNWNYGYRRFSIGVTLSSLLWSQDYWIDDPWYYHLPPAYGPYRWVRYYNDALLVDIETGEVVDTVYDIFW